MNFIYLIILALAVSLDSFGVGVTYGLRKVRIPFFSIIIIGLASAAMILLSMQLGVWISYIMSPYVAKWIGSIILIIVGIGAIYQVLTHSHDDDDVNKNFGKNIDHSEKKIISIEIRKFGLVIQILRKPMKADIDHSGIISALEATILGLALSLDAFGAGIGAALIGFKPLLTALIIAGMSGLFILVGMKIGFWFSDIKWVKKFTILPGIILILIGIAKIL